MRIQIHNNEINVYYLSGLAPEEDSEKNLFYPSFIKILKYIS